MGWGCEIGDWRVLGSGVLTVISESLLVQNAAHPLLSGVCYPDRPYRKAKPLRASVQFVPEGLVQLLSKRVRFRF